MCSNRLPLRCVEHVCRTGEQLGLSPTDVHNVFTSVISDEYKEQAKPCSKGSGACTAPSSRQWKGTTAIVSAVRCVAAASALVLLASVLLHLHNPTKKLLLRNIQDLIYPVMTSLRYITLPLVSKYPHLTQWYSEECLVPNTYFDQSNIDCNSCHEDVTLFHAVTLNNFTDAYYNSGKLVTVSDAMPRKVLLKNILETVDIQEEFRTGSLVYFSKSGKAHICTQDARECNFVGDDDHVEWKINRLDTLHVIRKMFPRAYFIPQKTEVALHRYIFIDGPSSEAYALPLTEFANIVLMQGEGKSRITMMPSSHCKTVCQPVTLNLDSSQVFFYNWVYWRPVRQGGNSTSVILMISFY